jgi:hypothetical protein
MLETVNLQYASKKFIDFCDDKALLGKQMLKSLLL